MRRCAFEGKTVDTSQGNVKRTSATIAAPSAPAGHQHQGIHRGIEMGRSKYTFLYHSARNRKFADLYGAFPVKGLLPVAGQLIRWLTGRERLFFVPSPAIRSPERALTE